MAQETHQPNVGEVEANRPNPGGVQTDGAPLENAVLQLKTLVQVVADGSCDPYCRAVGCERKPC